MSAGEAVNRKFDQEIPSGALPTPVMPLQETTEIKALAKKISIKDTLEIPEVTNTSEIVSEFLVEEKELFLEALDENIELTAEETRQLDDLMLEQVDSIPSTPDKSRTEAVEELLSESTDVLSKSEIEAAAAI